MVTLRNFISASLGLLVLTQCNNKQDSNSATPISLPSTSMQTENILTGKWRFTNSIWDTSELALQDDGTFKFLNRGCYGIKYSQGQWTNNNNIIQLTSFHIFKQQNDIQKPILPGPNDTVLIYLNKEQLHFKKDTLLWIGSEIFSEKARFHRTTDNQ